NRLGIALPVILGGAALTRRYVEHDLRAIYKGPLWYAKDAFEGLALAREVCEKAKEPALVAAAAAGGSGVEADAPHLAPMTPPPRVFSVRERPVPVDDGHEHAVALKEVAIPDAPFFGTRVVEGISLQAILPFLNERLLFQFQWGFKRGNKSEAQWLAEIDQH